MQLTPRQQEVLQHIQSDPTETTRGMAQKIGVSYQRIFQICQELEGIGAIEDRMALRRDALETKKRAAVSAREHKKTIWRRMMFVGLRQRIRHMARIDHHGLVYGEHLPGEQTICQFVGCTRPVRARGFCSNHYVLLRKTGSLWVRRRSRHRCKEPGCFYFVYARGFCQNHYEIDRRKNPVRSNLPAHNKSGYRGVCWNKSDKRWAANIRSPENRQEYLGTYESKETAARAYDTAARKYFGENAKLNFPDENIEVIKQPRQLAGRVSGVPGVIWDAHRSRWVVRIVQNGRCIYQRRFIDMDEAISNRAIKLSEFS